MFENFDPKVLDDPEFKEDAVREEIVVPILKRLGYAVTGANRIVRSKALLHPFVMIGSKKHPVHITPDYLLYSDSRPAWVLDAKRPDADLIRSKHAEQAYSYAIHPDVRVRFYALCNGKQLVAYDIYGISPIIVIQFGEIERDWDIIKSVLSPASVAHAPERYFVPDFGTAVVKFGTMPGSRFLFPFTKFSQFGMITEDLFTMTAGVPIAGVQHLVSFDSSKEVFMRILQLADEENREDLLKRLGVEGQMIYSKRPICAALGTVVGSPTRGQHDEFVPFLVYDVQPLDDELMRVLESMLAEERTSKGTNPTS